MGHRANPTTRGETLDLRDKMCFLCQCQFEEGRQQQIFIHWATSEWYIERTGECFSLVNHVDDKRAAFPNSPSQHPFTLFRLFPLPDASGFNKKSSMLLQLESFKPVGLKALMDKPPVGKRLIYHYSYTLCIEECLVVITTVIFEILPHHETQNLPGLRDAKCEFSGKIQGRCQV